MKIKIILLLLSSILAITACSNAGTSTPVNPFIKAPLSATLQATAAGNRKTIALVMKTLTNPFFQEMEKGARQAAAELGVELVVKTAAQETSIAQQIAIVEDLVRLKVDAIVIAPGDSRELIPPLKKAQDAGIVVVNIDNRLDSALSSQLGLVNVPFISVDNEKGAYLSAKTISNQIKTSTQVAILEGIREATNAQDRKNGAMRAFTENKNVQVIASETAHWKIDEAHTVFTAMIRSNPGIGAVFCANDMMALGVLQYLEENKISNVLVASFDNLEQVRPAILDGKLTATIDQQAAKQGYTGVVFASKLLKGEQVAPETLIDVLLVTKDSLK